MGYSPNTAGKTTVTTAGSPVALVTISTPANRVDIQALLSNTGNIAVGGIGVNASMPYGVILKPGDVYSIEKIVDLITIIVDSTVSGEGVSYTSWLGETN